MPTPYEISVVISFIIFAVIAGINGFRMNSRIKDLYDWHNKEGDDGVKVWYVRKSLEEAIIKMAEATEKQTELITMYHNEIRIWREKDKR